MCSHPQEICHGLHADIPKHCEVLSFMTPTQSATFENIFHFESKYDGINLNSSPIQAKILGSVLCRTKEPFRKQVLDPLQMRQITYTTMKINFLSNNFVCGLEKPLK